MQHHSVEFREGFEVLISNERSQAALMVLDVGETTGGPDNRHQNSDQWLYVVSGHGQANIDGQEVDLRTGTLLLIEQGEHHEIRNTGEERLQTLNFYVPPTY